MFDLKLKPDAKATHARLVVRVDGSGHMGTVNILLNPGAVGTSASADMALLPKLAPSSAPPTSGPASDAGAVHP
jgi:hypothetical protein